MNQDMYLGRPHMSDAQATNISLKSKLPAGTLIKADGSSVAQGESIYGVAGEMAFLNPEGTFTQTVWTHGYIYACAPTVAISNAHVVEVIEGAVRLDANGNKETVKDAVIIKL